MGAVLFLASSALDFVTGTTLEIGGGVLARQVRPKAAKHPPGAVGIVILCATEEAAQPWAAMESR